MSSSVGGVSVTSPPAIRLSDEPGDQRDIYIPSSGAALTAIASRARTNVSLRGFMVAISSMIHGGRDQTSCAVYKDTQTHYFEEAFILIQRDLGSVGVKHELCFQSFGS